jgi:hypothetical protein
MLCAVDLCATLRCNYSSKKDIAKTAVSQASSTKFWGENVKITVGIYCELDGDNQALQR